MRYTLNDAYACLHQILAVLMIFVVFVPVAVSADSVGGNIICPTCIVSLTNTVREQAGLKPLYQNEVVQKVADAKAQLMASRGEFAHTLSDGTTAWQMLDDVNYRYLAAGENLAVHFTDDEELVEAWMDSSTHKMNILSDRFTEIGIGVAEGEWQGYQGYFVVQLFATPFPNSSFVLSHL